MQSSTHVIEELLGSRGRIAILRLLATSTVAMTGRQVAELAGLTPAGATRALERLAALGVVKRRRVGSAVLHELERDNAIVQHIVLPVFAAEGELSSRLQSDIAETFGEDAVSIVLFGSMAREDGPTAGDIDVLVVTEDALHANRVEERAATEGARYFRAYGKPLSVITKSRADLNREQPAFLRGVIRDGVTVAGLPLEEIVDAPE